MQGNLHVRFLGESDAEMHHPYPTCGRVINAAKAIKTNSKKSIRTIWRFGSVFFYNMDCISACDSAFL